MLAEGPILTAYSGLCRRNRAASQGRALDAAAATFAALQSPGPLQTLDDIPAARTAPDRLGARWSSRTHPSLGGFWASSPSLSLSPDYSWSKTLGRGEAGAQSTGVARAWGAAPTHPRSSHRLPLGFLLCRPVPPAARCTHTWASRSRADLEALAQVNPSNPLIPGTKIGKISRSVGKALGQS